LNHEVVKSRALANYDDARLNDEVTELLSRIGALDALKDARRVVLKPNWVHHENPLGHDSTSLVTQTEVIEAVAHAVAARLQTGGEVLIADAPVQNLQLIGGEHDWGTILGPQHLDIVQSAGTIAQVVRTIGLLLWCAAVVGAVRGLLFSFGATGSSSEARDPVAATVWTPDDRFPSK